MTNIVSDQQTALRTAFEEGLSSGDNPTEPQSTSLAGSTGPQAGAEAASSLDRAPQERFVANACQELLAGDPEAIQNYLARGKRDKVFDRTVAKALREGKPIPREMVDNIVGRYADKLLKLRADTVAHNETMASLWASKDIAFRQQVEAGKLRADVVAKTWKHAPQAPAYSDAGPESGLRLVIHRAGWDVDPVPARTGCAGPSYARLQMLL